MGGPRLSPAGWVGDWAVGAGAGGGRVAGRPHAAALRVSVRRSALCPPDLSVDSGRRSQPRSASLSSSPSCPQGAAIT